MDDLGQLDAVACADLVRSGEVRAQELVEAAISRIEERNPALNAVLTPAFDRARALAGDVDRAFARTGAADPDRPLAGVPFLIKDQLDWSGVRTTNGSAFLRDYLPAEDSPMVRRYLAAGLIPLGKTNVPECGLLATTEPVAYGPTGNPWDLTRTPGGSSGGSAAAVAAGMVPVASASDGGGSIRIPAAACGLFGLKPTRGRTAVAGWGGLAVTHALTRTVRDSAALLDATCGPEPGDVTPLRRPERPFRAAVGVSPGRLRIAVSTHGWEGVRYHPAVLAAVHEAAELLASLGHEVVEGRPDLPSSTIALMDDAVGKLVAAATARTIDRWAAATGRPVTAADVEPLTWDFVQQGRQVSGVDYLKALEVQHSVVAMVTPFFDQHDSWLLPTVAEPAPPLGVWQFPPQAPTFGGLRMAMFVPPVTTQLANWTGQPAMSVPMHVDPATGLPIGLQFYGRWGQEATLFQLAGQLEQACPWADRWPPMS